VDEDIKQPEINDKADLPERDRDAGKRKLLTRCDIELGDGKAVIICDTPEDREKALASLREITVIVREEARKAPEDSIDGNPVESD